MDEQIEMDDETGLPKLPENMFWNVRKDHYQVRDGNSVDFRQRVEVALFEKYEYIHMIKKRKWFFFREDVSVPYTGQNMIFSTHVLGVNGTEFLSPEDLTKDHIRDAAIREFEKYRRSQEAAKLFGEYPPKSIKENTND